jgi:hypothetical protein
MIVSADWTMSTHAAMVRVMRQRRRVLSSSALGIGDADTEPA